MMAWEALYEKANGYTWEDRHVQYVERPRLSMCRCGKCPASQGKIHKDWRLYLCHYCGNTWKEKAE